MTMTTKLVPLFALLAVGCTAPNPGEEVATLDGAAIVNAHGARPESQVGMHRQGVIDPRGSDVTLAVSDARLKLRTTATGAIVDLLRLELADQDFPPTTEMPQGLKLRTQSLSAIAALPAQVIARDADHLTVRVAGSLKYSSSMLLPDGTLYHLGHSYTESEFMTVNVTRTATGVTVTLDSTPENACARIGELVTLSGCTLYVEADGSIDSSK
jgi:hypothetical protein